MGAVNREALLGLPLRTETVPVPELGNGTVAHVREMTAAHRERWELEAFETDGKARRAKPGLFRAYLIVFGVVTEQGEPLFGVDDLDAVSRMPAPVVERLANAVIRVSGLNETEDELKGN